MAKTDIDPATQRERARKAWKSHGAHAHWMIMHGYRQLVFC